MATKSSSLAAGLIDACRNTRLFNFDLWPRQAELLRTVEDGPRVHVWALGRRSGKTTMAALVCLWDCLLSPDLSSFLRRGERRFAVAVAVNLRQSRLIVEAARTIVARSPALASLVESQTDDEITFSNGTSLAAFPCTSRGGRGWPISTLVMDEAAHFVDSEGNSSAEQVWRALMPATAQFGHGARIIVASTPFGSDGLFADLWAKADAGELEDATASRFATAEMNPTAEIRDVMRLELARDPDGFRSEYEAQFVGSGLVFLDPERITEAVEDRGELDPSQAEFWCAGLDPRSARIRSGWRSSDAPRFVSSSKTGSCSDSRGRGSRRARSRLTKSESTRTRCSPRSRTPVCAAGCRRSTPISTPRARSWTICSDAACQLASST
jgi:hypothetical protein